MGAGAVEPDGDPAADSERAAGNRHAARPGAGLPGDVSARPIAYSLWFLCEIAIAACDLAEVLGAAIALNLLFHIPLLTGVLLTAADTLLLLWFTRPRDSRDRELRAGADCDYRGLLPGRDLVGRLAGVRRAGAGLVPHITAQNLYIAIGILGATVMPHNLYLHSALVQTRRIGTTPEAKKMACRLQFDRFDHRAERRAAGECGHPDPGRDGVLQARHRGDRDPAGQPVAVAAAGHHDGERAVRCRRCFARGNRPR